ncbi:conserved hypothetical protein [Ricinus communis]|uniref:Uncharacterized protein n=1 Tax=Ricinus communis TaxID=3988 RepID=B9RPE3_RICCO|nr:conserved hypothetical protein [Ricinus communis]
MGHIVQKETLSDSKLQMVYRLISLLPLEFLSIFKFQKCILLNKGESNSNEIPESSTTTEAPAISVSVSNMHSDTVGRRSEDFSKSVITVVPIASFAADKLNTNLMHEQSPAKRICIK